MREKKVRLQKADPIIDNQILLLFDSPYGCLLAQVGTFRIGVAVASQVLCTSTTLNKRFITILNFHIISIC